MRASLDTNAIIHFYRADLRCIIFDFFDEVFIYEQIRTVELKNHGEDILEFVDADIETGKIKLYTDQELKENSVLTIFRENVKENRLLYGTGDLGEVYAISLAQTLGAYVLVTDDIKQGGPYMSLLQFEDEVIMPFTFADVLILRYLTGKTDVNQTVAEFNLINYKSNLNWSFRSQVTKFVLRFLTNPYHESDKDWIYRLAEEHDIKIKDKLSELIKNI